MIVAVQDIPVFASVVGSGKPLIAIHGFVPDHRLMKGCLEPAFTRRQGWRRIYFDLPGMGMTPAAEHIRNSDDMLNLVIEVIDQLCPEEPFALVGESYGGYLARAIVKKMPERVLGLMLLCPMIFADQSQRHLPPHSVLERHEMALAAYPVDVRQEIESNCVIQTPETLYRYQEEILPAIQVADHDFLEKFRNEGYAFSEDIDRGMTPYERPTLFLTGRQDASTGYQDPWKILENYPHASFATLDRAGHNLQIEQPGLFNTLTMDWLERVERTLNKI
ncbi:MAG: 2-hydroxy-6-oxo-6-phenylhexa-2,4-dienoate hydrolase [Chloroflexi bacterium HGW-Chloroflexi-10]|nr:MAG: 2-hydroxy-6-oxo-6-phenylhexa-2,4-dienoate hydrolase [Chloroflexi bacterium HGW-Chloroflexi-10]